MRRWGHKFPHSCRACHSGCKKLNLEYYTRGHCYLCRCACAGAVLESPALYCRNIVFSVFKASISTYVYKRHFLKPSEFGYIPHCLVSVKRLSLFFVDDLSQLGWGHVSAGFLDQQHAGSLWQRARWHR